MSTFDPKAAAMDWLDHYRTSSLSIVDLYTDDAALECGCDGAKILHGRNALTAYWRQRFSEKPATALRDLQMDGRSIALSYAVAGRIVQARFFFNDEGK